MNKLVADEAVINTLEANDITTSTLEATTAHIQNLVTDIYTFSPRMFGFNIPSTDP